MPNSGDGCHQSVSNSTWKSSPGTIDSVCAFAAAPKPNVNRTHTTSRDKQASLFKLSPDLRLSRAILPDVLRRQKQEATCGPSIYNAPSSRGQLCGTSNRLA